MVELIIIPGKRIQLDIDVGESIASILEYADISLNENQSVFIAKNKVPETDYHKVHVLDGIVIIASGTKGYAPTPKWKSTIKYLKSKGFEKVVGGKGDHEKFQDPNGNTIIINRDNTDKQHICLGSAKSLASAFNMNIVQLFAEIQ
ncbi:hypothetical protein [Dasania marina]|uniref:hypothetical protein n=1 Tax=Dasania marina TaxID=471499 RepID=UPI0030DC8369|tara:strand:- start:16782 stop:17219 length:438 start_codon:yes stop_codon:yes gene_type:complete